MRRKLVNQYKFKKRLRRLFQSGVQPIVSPDTVEIKSTKDFAWHRTKQNPFYRTEKPSFRTKFFTIVGIMSFLGMIGIGIFHPFFYISKIEAEGISRLSKEEFLSSAYGAMEYKKFLVFPAKSYFLADVDEIRDILFDRFPLTDIIVQKNFPNIITITVQEKMSKIIYDNGVEYSYLGLDGRIVEIIRKVGDNEWKRIIETVTSTSAAGAITTTEKIVESVHVPAVRSLREDAGDYPVVYDMRNDETAEINAVRLSVDWVKNIIFWFETANVTLQKPFGYIIIQNNQGESILKLRDGHEVKLNISHNADEQIATLQTALGLIGGSPYEYVDVRYQGKVFWQ